MKLTEHFTLEELATTNNAKYKKVNLNYAENNLDQIKVLALFSEQVRAILNVPMVISSGYRCKELNKEVGGSNSSQHILFQAIDFIPKKISIQEAFNILKNSVLVYGQLIIEKSGNSEWIHVSMGYKKENLRYINGKYEKVK